MALPLLPILIAGGLLLVMGKKPAKKNGNGTVGNGAVGNGAVGNGGGLPPGEYHVVGNMKDGAVVTVATPGLVEIFDDISYVDGEGAGHGLDVHLGDDGTTDVAMYSEGTWTVGIWGEDARGGAWRGDDWRWVFNVTIQETG
jgi:hypothetical protein